MCDTCDKITLEAGSDGDSAYVYIAYASDTNGTNFSLTASNSLDYISIVSSTTPQTNNAALHSGNWVLFQGADGIATNVLYNNIVPGTTASTSYSLLDAYAVSAGTMAIGDKMVITGNISQSVNGDCQFELRFNGTQYSTKQSQFTLLSEILQMNYKVSITQASATSLYVETVALGSWPSGGSYGLDAMGSRVYMETISILDMDANAFSIEVYGRDGNTGAGATAISEQLTVELFKI